MTAKHVYLAMYTDREWVPVSWSKVVQGQCCFTRLGTNTVYLPVYYQDSVSAPWAPPFILYSNGDMQHFMPDKTLDTLVISRIRPYYDNSDRLNHYFPGSHFESADDSKLKKIILYLVILIINGDISVSIHCRRNVFGAIVEKKNSPFI